MKLFFNVLLVLLFIFVQSSAQIQSGSENVRSRIKTARVFVEGNELSYPNLLLNGNETLRSEFDLLGNDAKNFSYRIVHCDADWNKSLLDVDEYMEGFEENTLSQYSYSANTVVSYVHYQVNIPNDDVKLLVSGNYKIQFFESDRPELVVVEFKFSLYESLVGIRAEIIRPLGIENQNIGHELRFSVLHEDVVINDPFTEIKLEISQNNRPDKTKKNIRPLFVKNNELVYGMSGEHVFKAGNEFRTFDMKNFKGIGLNVNDIQFVDSMYFVQLRLDERRSFKKYFWEKEMNGKYLIYTANNFDYEVTSDYAKVFFELSMPEPFIDGNVYVFGNYNQWNIGDGNKMVYNYDAQSYELQLDLKQGYYNYNYVFVNNYDKLVDDQFIEGSHYQTEDDYIIKVYYRQIGDDFDRLIGYRVINSKYQ